ncbi:MAG: response regulator transcription factor [Ktedonobacterales bacterium]
MRHSGARLATIAICYEPAALRIEIADNGSGADADSGSAERRQQLADVRVIVLTTFDLDEYVFEALRVGASGFLLKDIEPDDLRQVVRVVAAGDALLSPRVTRRLITQFVALSPQAPMNQERLAALTDREREVMALVAWGLSNEEIGQRLAMSPATAKTHVSRAMLKLDARDRAQLVVLAYQSGLVTPAPH